MALSERPDGAGSPEPGDTLPRADRVREARTNGAKANQRAILVSTHYLGLPATEIAGRLGIPVGTANSRLHYAHRAMRAAIEADERPVAMGGGGLR